MTLVWRKVEKKVVTLVWRKVEKKVWRKVEKKVEKKIVMTYDNSYTVRNLRKIAQQKYVIGFSRMNKSQLINILNQRTRENLLIVPQVIFTLITDYTSILDKMKMIQVSKTTRLRTKENMTKEEKKMIKKPKDYMDKIIKKVLKMTKYYDFDKIKILNNIISNNFEVFYSINSFKYKKKIVELIKGYLNLCERCVKKPNKVKVALMIMKFLSYRKTFLINHQTFALIVSQKMIEFDSEEAIDGDNRIEMDYYKTRIENIVSGFTDEQLQEIF